MREYAGLAKSAVHIGGSVYDKRDCEKQSLCRLFVFTAVHKTNLLRFKFCFFVFSYRLQLRQKLSE